MKSMLFRPFDIGKWLTIAFAAFLAGGWAGGGNARGISKVANGDWRYRVTRHGDLGVDWDFTPWIISAAIGIFLIGLVLGIVWLWISSRGKFIFTDCVVKKRGTIGEPWREFRREGNSYFFFALAVAAGMLALAFLTVIAVVLPLGSFSGERTLTAASGSPLIIVLPIF